MNWFEGALSVKAVMMSGRRPVIKLVIDQKKKDKDTAFILRQAAQRQIPVDAREDRSTGRRAYPWRDFSTGRGSELSIRAGMSGRSAAVYRGLRGN